jgi:tripartite-type tricarboxylate transporter receptor subunit TctC
VLKLNTELAKALSSDDIRKRFEDMGLVAKPSSPEEFGRFLQSEMTRWKALLVQDKAR